MSTEFDKTFQIEAMIALIKKKVLIFSHAKIDLQRQKSFESFEKKLGTFSKGQLISKRFFGVVYFLQKKNKNKSI